MAEETVTPAERRSEATVHSQMPVPPARGPVTWRSLLIGTIGVLFISILTPFNDYILNNTSLVGSALPIGLLLFFLLFIALINAAFNKWIPSLALGAPELATALAMTMVSCAIPGSAFLKYTPAHLVGIWGQAARSNSYRQVLETSKLPDWMFPTMQATTALRRSQDPVVRDYLGRVPTLHDTFIEHWQAVPWSAWRTPAISWGILLMFIFGTAICMASLVHRQWSEVERLPFPLATLYASLIEPPAAGHSLNALFRNRYFWIAFGSVFTIHGLNAMSVYYPRVWPAFPISYDLRNIFTNPPWTYVDPNVAKAAISFSVVGLTYFVQQKIAFSIWFCMVGLTLPRMLTEYTGTDWPGEGFHDQIIGALVPYVAMILWVGRHEWAMVIRRMFGQARKKDEQSRYLPFGVAGWGMVLCTAGIAAWLLVIGAGWPGMFMLVFFLLTLMLVIMRVVAETGIVAIQFLLAMNRPWNYLFHVRPSLAADDATVKPYFISAFFNVLFTVPQREPISVFVSQSLRTEDYANAGALPSRWRGWSIVGSMAAALAIGYVSSGASLLYYEYKYAATLDKTAESPVNKYGVGESATYALQEAATLQETHAIRPESCSRASPEPPRRLWPRCSESVVEAGFPSYPFCIR
jgi:hypothetical protein